MNRERILDFAKTNEDKLLLSRLCDAARAAEKSFTSVATRFLNGYELSLAKRALVGNVGVNFSDFGGYDGAERRVIAFYPDFAEPNYGISFIEATGRELEALSHRDYLGSVLALGIVRDKIGDIIIGKNGCIICRTEIADYITAQLERIANTPVRLKITDGAEVEIPEKKFKEIFATVPSLRLDCVLSAGAKMSRSDAADTIKAGRVTVNWEDTANPGVCLKENQIISIKGFGRLELFQIKGETKKGRIAVVIKRFI